MKLSRNGAHGRGYLVAVMGSQLRCLRGCYGVYTDVTGSTWIVTGSTRMLPGSMWMLRCLYTWRLLKGCHVHPVIAT